MTYESKIHVKPHVWKQCFSSHSKILFQPETQNILQVITPEIVTLPIMKYQIFHSFVILGILTQTDTAYVSLSVDSQQQHWMNLWNIKHICCKSFQTCIFMSRIPVFVQYDVCVSAVTTVSPVILDEGHQLVTQFSQLCGNLNSAGWSVR